MIAIESIVHVNLRPHWKFPGLSESPSLSLFTVLRDQEYGIGHFQRLRSA